MLGFEPFEDLIRLDIAILGDAEVETFKGLTGSIEEVWIEGFKVGDGLDETVGSFLFDGLKGEEQHDRFDASTELDSSEHVEVGVLFIEGSSGVMKAWIIT